MLGRVKLLSYLRNCHCCDAQLAMICSRTALRSNRLYQLGDGTDESRGDEGGEMGNNLSIVDLGADFVPVDMAAGGNHVCAMTEAKAVKCWGQLFLFVHLQTLL